MTGRRVTRTLAALCLLPAVTARAELLPTVGMTERFTDNVYSQARDAQSSNITTLGAGLDLLGISGPNKYDLGASVEQGHYSIDSTNDYQDWRLNGKTALLLDNRNRVRYLAEYRQGHDEIGTARTEGVTGKLLAREPDIYHDTLSDLGYTLGTPTGRVRVDLRNIYLNREYNSGDHSVARYNRSENEYRATMSWRVMPKTVLLLEDRSKAVWYSEMRLPGDPRGSDENRLYLGAEWEPTAKLTTSLRVGQLNKDMRQTPAGEQNDYRSPSWEGLVKWQPRSYSQFTVDTSRGAEASTSSGSYVDREDLRLGWKHQWSARLDGELRWRNYRDDFPGTQRQDHTTSTGVGLHYAWSRSLGFNAGYMHEQRDSSLDTVDYRRNILTFGVGLKFR